MARPWRILVFAIACVAGLALISSALLYFAASGAVDNNKKLICGLTAVISGSPLQRPEGLSDRQYLRQLIPYEQFLHGIERLTDGVNCDAATIQALDGQLKQLEETIDRLEDPTGAGKGSPTATAPPSKADAPPAIADAPPEETAIAAAPSSSSSAPTPQPSAPAAPSGSQPQPPASSPEPPPAPQPPPSSPEPPPDCTVNALGICVDLGL